MFLLSNLTKRVTAASLLVVFLNVFVEQCLCAAIMPMARAERVAVAAPVKPKHPGCHGHAKKAATGQQPAPTKQSHECCKDKSAAVLKGLTTPPTEKPIVAGPLWVALPPAQDFTFAWFTDWDTAQAVRLVPPQHLPPKIPDIRIFVGSLTISGRAAVKHPARHRGDANSVPAAGLPGAGPVPSQPHFRSEIVRRETERPGT